MFYAIIVYENRISQSDTESGETMPEENFIATRDLDEVAKIHSNPQYADWRFEYVDSEYRFYSPQYQKKDSKVKEEDTYVTLEQLESLLSESGYMCYGHGTGRSGDSDEVVDSIFQKGLRIKDNSLYYTSIGLSTPTPEIKQEYKELDLPEPSIESLKEQLNHWQHQDSKKIIIARLPKEYINGIGDRSDLDGEMFGAFYTQDIGQDGKTVNYLDPRFIVGCFDVEKQAVRLNKNYERTLTPQTIARLKEGYRLALEKTQRRLKALEDSTIMQEGAVPSQEQETLPSFEAYDNFDFPEIEWEETSDVGKSM